MRASVGGVCSMAGPDDPHPQEAEDPDLATKRAEVLERFLREKPWELSLA